MLKLKPLTTPFFLEKRIPKIWQNLVHIIGENSRYIEPFLAESERACQEAGSHKSNYATWEDVGNYRYWVVKLEKSTVYPY